MSLALVVFVLSVWCFRRISMSLRGCLCRLHRPLTRSKMPSRLCLRGCCCLLGCSQMQIVAFVQDEKLQETVQETEEIKEVLRL